MKFIYKIIAQNDIFIYCRLQTIEYIMMRLGEKWFQLIQLIVQNPIVYPSISRHVKIGSSIAPKKCIYKLSYHYVPLSLLHSRIPKSPWSVLTCTTSAADCLIGTQPTCELSPTCGGASNQSLPLSHCFKVFVCFCPQHHLQESSYVVAMFVLAILRIAERFRYCLLAS